MNEMSEFDYDLPAELIATSPAPEREKARMLVVDRARQQLLHRTIADLPEFLGPNDALVLNDTRVVPAKLPGSRSATGGKWEGLFLRTDETGCWRLICQTRGKLQVGETIEVMSNGRGDGDRSPLYLSLVARNNDGSWLARAQTDENVFDVLQRYGTVPLPPYIGKTQADQSDWERYQTEYARVPGAVAAPTAGLHITRQLLKQLESQGAKPVFVTLHVGLGTFRPISVDRLDDHQMHTEWCELTENAADQLNDVRSTDGRVVAVGTTSVRTLETAYRDGQFQPFCGETDLFIRPPYAFPALDMLLTNFHLPKTTLLVLVSAFAGTEFTRRVYEEAIAEKYRFYSYGDAMLIV